VISGDWNEPAKKSQKSERKRHLVLLQQEFVAFLAQRLLRRVVQVRIDAIFFLLEHLLDFPLMARAKSE